MRSSRDVVAGVAAAVRDHYFDAEEGARAAEALAGEFAAAPLGGPAYDAGLASTLTAALQRSLPDPRVQVRWSDEPLAPRPVAPRDARGHIDYQAREDLANQGVSRVERMEGNVGLMVVQSVGDAEVSAAVLDAAFAFLARCSALVLDLRRTFGGAPGGAACLLGHLLPAGTPLIEVVDRDGEVIETTETRGIPPRSPTLGTGAPVYVLVGRRTVGACEELAYDLQVAGRATVVGVTTPGAANPVGIFPVDPHVLVRVPIARVRHRLTGGTWEGLGVLPDVPCAVGDALAVAHRLAAREVLAQVRSGAIPYGEILLEELLDVLAALDEDLGLDG